MDPLSAVTHSIDQLLQQAVNEGLLDDQFLQLMQLQVGARVHRVSCMPRPI